MNPSVIAGGEITRVIAVLASFPIATAVLVGLIAGQQIPVQAWLCLVLSLAMSWLLVQGSEWARGWIITGLSLSGLGAVVQLAMDSERMGFASAATLTLIGAAYLVGAGLLGWSSSVQAYFHRANQSAALELGSK
jgi:hypothetical protein